MWPNASDELVKLEAFLAVAYQVSQVEAQAFCSPVTTIGISHCHAGVENVLLCIELLHRARGRIAIYLYCEWADCVGERTGCVGPVDHQLVIV